MNSENSTTRDYRARVKYRVAKYQLAHIELRDFLCNFCDLRFITIDVQIVSGIAYFLSRLTNPLTKHLQNKFFTSILKQNVIKGKPINEVKIKKNIQIFQQYFH